MPAGIHDDDAADMLVGRGGDRGKQPAAQIVVRIQPAGAERDVGTEGDLRKHHRERQRHAHAIADTAGAFGRGSSTRIQNSMPSPIMLQFMIA